MTHVDEVKRIEVFYDHGIIEVFVNDGEAAGAMLAYDERKNGGFSVSGDTSARCARCAADRAVTAGASG